jgi:hypothetical protein
MRLPWLRLGLLVIIGALFAPVVNFYIGMWAHFANLGAEDLSTEPRDLVDHFTANFLFAGSTPGILFWVGIALCIVGIARNFLGGRGKPRPS